MQKQTFEQIKEMKERIKRLEYWIVGGMGSCSYNFTYGHRKIMNLTRNFTLSELLNQTLLYVRALTITLTQNK